MTEIEEFLTYCEALSARVDLVIERGRRILAASAELREALGIDPQVLISRIVATTTPAERARLEALVYQHAAKFIPANADEFVVPGVRPPRRCVGASRQPV